MFSRTVVKYTIKVNVTCIFDVDTICEILIIVKGRCEGK